MSSLYSRVTSQTNDLLKTLAKEFLGRHGEKFAYYYIVSSLGYKPRFFTCLSHNGV